MSKDVKIVEIVWYDSGAVDGVVWEFKDEYKPERHEIRSVGYLIEKTIDYVAIAQSENKDQWGRTFVIPVGCIKYIRELKVPAESEQQ